MKFKAYGMNIRKEDYDTIRAMAKIVTNEIIDIYDLRSYEVDIKPTDIVFVYGHKAEMQCKDMPCITQLVFPEVEKLSKDLGDQEERLAAKIMLNTLRDVLDSGKLNNDNSLSLEKQTEVLTEESIPDPTQLQALEQVLNKKNIDSWIGITRNGKRIKLSRNPETSSADINMTFAEFVNLRRFMEVFNIKETKIVYKPTAVSNKDTNNLPS